MAVEPTLPVRPDAKLRGQSAGFTGIAAAMATSTASVATFSNLAIPSRSRSRSQPSSRTILSRSRTNQPSNDRSLRASRCVGSLHTTAIRAMLPATG